MGMRDWVELYKSDARTRKRRRVGFSLLFISVILVGIDCLNRINVFIDSVGIIKMIQ